MESFKHSEIRSYPHLLTEKFCKDFHNICYNYLLKFLFMDMSGIFPGIFKAPTAPKPIRLPPSTQVSLCVRKKKLEKKNLGSKTFKLEVRIIIH